MIKYSSRTLGLISGTIGSLIFGCLLVTSIFRSTSSTASIGLIFVPIQCLIAFILFFVLGYAIGYARNLFNKDQKDITFKSLIAIGFVAVLGGYIGKEVVTNTLVMKVVSEIESTQSNEKLVSIFNESPLGRNKFVLGAMAQNQSASSELLDRIARLEDPELHERMGSLFPLLGKNGKGLAVMRLVILNPNVASHTVEYLAHSKNEYVLGTIAGSPKASEPTLRRLAQEEKYLIDWGLAQNLKTPPDLFAHLLNRKMDFTQQTTLDMLLRNPSVPIEIQNGAKELLAKAK